MKTDPLHKTVFRKVKAPVRRLSHAVRDLEYFRKKRLAGMAPAMASVDALVHSIVGTRLDRLVYIVQGSFFNPQGTVFYSGGAERYALDLADIIKGMGYSVVLLQNAKVGGEVWHNVHRGLDVVGVPCGNSAGMGDFLQTLPTPALIVYACPDAYGKLLHPNIRISHGVTWDNVNEDLADARLLYRQLLEGSDAFISVDTNTISWFRATLAKTLFDSRKRMAYIPNYVDHQVFKPAERQPSDRLKITFPRRCSRERGYWETAEILPRLLDKYPSVDFEFVGAPCHASIEKDLERLKKLYPRQILHRVVDAEAMCTVYQNTDISIIPTIYSEGTSLSCLEAMATGNAVVATNIGGLSNLILNGFNGLLINPDSESLFAALCRLIDDPALRASLAGRALETSFAFGKTAWVERWTEILQQFLRRD